MVRVNLSQIFFGNTVQAYMEAALMFIITICVLWIFKNYVIRLLHKAAKRTKAKADDALVNAIRAVHWPFYVLISAYVSILHLAVASWIERTLLYVLIVVVAYYIVRMLQQITMFFVEKYAAEQDRSDSVALAHLFGRIINVVLWVVAGLVVLANFGIEITPLIASLGIGGIAIAFALQNILEDLFSAFTIYFDKPFKPGDFIVLGNDKGTVKYVGLRSTRIDTLQGQELIVSNRELTNTRVENFKKMDERRVMFSIGVEYGTPVKKLEKINSIVEKIITGVPKAKFGRSHFKEFGDFSLNYEIVFFVEVPDFTEYLNIRQQINLAIVKAFQKEKIEMAFPTQTVFVKKA